MKMRVPSKVDFKPAPAPAMKNAAAGFLIDHSQFSDAQAPRMKGAARYERTPSISKPVSGN